MDGQEVLELLSMPEFGVSLTRIITRGIPLQALRSEPQFKVSFGADILEVGWNFRPSAHADFNCEDFLNSSVRYMPQVMICLPCTGYCKRALRKVGIY